MRGKTAKRLRKEAEKFALAVGDDSKSMRFYRNLAKEAHRKQNER